MKAISLGLVRFRFLAVHYFLARSGLGCITDYKRLQIAALREFARLARSISFLHGSVRISSHCFV